MKDGIDFKCADREIQSSRFIIKIIVIYSIFSYMA